MPGSVNKVFLLGNLTRDPELKPAGGSNVASFGLATNRKYTTSSGEHREDTCFVDCEAWGRTAEVMAEHLHKGDPVHVEGRLKLDQWEDRDGNKRSKLTVTVEQFTFVGAKT